MPWSRKWQPTTVFLPGESPWTEEPGRLQSKGCKKLDTTERLSTCTHVHTHTYFSSKITVLVMICKVIILSYFHFFNITPHQTRELLDILKYTGPGKMSQLFFWNFLQLCVSLAADLQTLSGSDSSRISWLRLSRANHYVLVGNYVDLLSQFI